MKIRCIVDMHDVTAGKLYATLHIDPDNTLRCGQPSVWVLDDTNGEYILFGDEYEVVEE